MTSQIKVPESASVYTTTATSTIKAPRKSNSGVEALVRAKLADYPVLIDIARCESRFRQWDASGNPLRGTINPKDVGVFQINEFYHLKKSLRMKTNIYSLEGNIAYAKMLYDKEGSTPWGWSGHCWR